MCCGDVTIKVIWFDMEVGFILRVKINKWVNEQVIVTLFFITGTLFLITETPNSEAASFQVCIRRLNVSPQCNKYCPISKTPLNAASKCILNFPGHEGYKKIYHLQPILYHLLCTNRIYFERKWQITLLNVSIGFQLTLFQTIGFQPIKWSTNGDISLTHMLLRRFTWDKDPINLTCPLGFQNVSQPYKLCSDFPQYQSLRAKSDI